jgi:hypothetical protein
MNYLTRSECCAMRKPPTQLNWNNIEEIIRLQKQLKSISFLDKLIHLHYVKKEDWYVPSYDD